MLTEAYYIRHGETAWSLSGRHTGTTDIPLTSRGEADARALAPRLGAIPFLRVLTSPRARARQTCELAGLGAHAIVELDLVEWNYGAYEGLVSAEIRRQRPDWNLFRDGCPGGESPQEVAARADRLIERLRRLDGPVALFSHGHFGRMLGARWVGFEPAQCQRLLLDPASVSILGYEHESRDEPVLAKWNLT